VFRAAKYTRSWVRMARFVHLLVVPWGPGFTIHLTGAIHGQSVPSNGQRPMVGNNVSRNNKTKRRFLPNLQYRRFFRRDRNRWCACACPPRVFASSTRMGIDAVLADLRARGEIHKERRHAP